MIKIAAIALCCLTASLWSFAQPSDLYKATHSWSSSPTLHTMPEKFKDESAVYIMDSRIFEYKFENKDFYQYNHYYKLIKVQDDKGIEMFNKVYIPVSRNAEIMDIKARVITSAGKVMNIPDDKIKEVTEEGVKYKLFAMEGIDKGSEVEYTYIVKRLPSFFGSEIYQTQKVPFHQAKILVITPDHLKFAAKGYNGFTVLQDSTINDRYFIAGYSSDIPGLDEEKYGFRDPYLQRVDFKIQFNLAQKKDVELYSWKEFVSKAYTNTTTLNDKEKKAVNKFVEKANLPASATEEKKIMLLEDYLKTKINIDEDFAGEDVLNIDAIIKTSNTNNFGALRLMHAMLENQNIKAQIVFPSLRHQLPIDEDLANWNRADDAFLYFPSTGKYLEPASVTMRYPFIEPLGAGTRGLFIKGATIGDLKTATGRFDDISIASVDESTHNMELDCKINASLDSLIVQSKQILTGYGASNYRPIWSFLPKDKQEEVIKEIIEGVAQSKQITNIKCENTALTDFWDNKPLIIGATIHSSEILEKAGNKILFKVGELLGSQVQMYQEKKRMLPPQLGYPHLLERHIKFEVPQGYIIKNPESIKLNLEHKKDGKVTMGFVSNYKLENNILTIHVLETYSEILYPLEEYENFKAVINAAADFNKIVLILEKKA